jgi:hypothetical protein
VRSCPRFLSSGAFRNGTSIRDNTAKEASSACRRQGDADRPASGVRAACARGSLAASQKDGASRPEAIRRLVELGLAVALRAGVRMERAAQAAEMASQEIDRVVDPSATDEERQLRKRRLIKGPGEFQDLRRKRRKTNG